MHLNKFLMVILQCSTTDKPEQQPEWLKDLDHEDISVLQGNYIYLSSSKINFTILEGSYGSGKSQRIQKLK